jgi:hypothetical protein
VLVTSDSTCVTRRYAATIDMLAIASLWCVTLLLVWPIGDFPLNDDWSYGLATKAFLSTGDFRPMGWVAMPLITNVLWGSLFCLPFGFSFTALRLSTLTLSLMGLLGVYAFLRELNQPRWFAVMTALTLGFNPLYYPLSNTFMTDVPFTAMIILASLCFARSIRHDSIFHLLIGTVLAVAATLSRQLGIAIVLAFALSVLLARGLTKKNMLRAAVPSVVCVGSLVAFQEWLAASGRLPALYHVKAEGLFATLASPRGIVRSLVMNAPIALLYLGLFLLPVLVTVVAVAVWPHLKRRKETVVALLAGALAMLVIVSVLARRSGEKPLMPLSGNILIGSGIGPLTLRDTYILKIDHVPSLPVSFWLAVTALSVLGAAILIAVLGFGVVNVTSRLWRGTAMSDNDAVGVFLVLSGLIYLVPLLVGGFLDRYLIPAVPLFAIGLVGMYEQGARGQSGRTWPLAVAGVALLTAFGIFAIGTTRDYLTWNRVRWEALKVLIEDDHVNAAEIDGGFEFNGLHFYDPNYKGVPGKSWWWAQGDAYQIGFGSTPDYDVVKKYNYSNWIPPRIGALVVLRRRQ